MALSIRYPIDWQQLPYELFKTQTYLNNVAGSAGGSIAEGLATQVVIEAGATKTLSSADHNKIIACTAACTVTVPSTLTSGLTGVPFTCGISKDGTGNVTVATGAGATVNAPGNKKVASTQYQLMTLTEWASASFRLYGGEA